MPLVHRLVLNIYFQEGFLWELTKTKPDVGTYPSATKTGWENHPEKPREDFPQNVMLWHGNGSFCQKFSGSLDMTFNSFSEVYQNDLQNRIRQKHMGHKEQHHREKILPYFGNKRVRDVKPVDVLHWQNNIMETTDENGMPYSPGLSQDDPQSAQRHVQSRCALLWLAGEPCSKSRQHGQEKCGEVLVWTKDEYLQFIETLKDKPASYYAFETLYWCGLRLGEMLALTPSDFDFERKIIHVTKSFQRIKGEDIITPPKTEKGIRT